MTEAPVDDDWNPPPPVRTRRPGPPEPVRSETARTEAVLKYLKALPETYAFKKHTGAHGEPGHPDIFACHRGRMVLVEMKVPGRKPTALQMQRLRIWQEAGAAVCWANEVEHVRELLERTEDPDYRNPLTRPGAP
ncbi:MAG: hypothetical protein HOY78_02320 [Saccharothrix sp.]|nr:hypothetical protein [Saccharothrix sp.]